MPIRNWLVLGFLLAQTTVSAQMANLPTALSLEEARAMRARGKALKAEAERTFKEEEAVCRSQAIAINCLSSAKERRATAVGAADALERQGRDAEREVRRQQVEARSAQRAAEASGREARQQADAEAYREQQARRAAERERDLAEESAKAERLRGKFAAEQAARQKRLEQRRKEDAQRAEQAPEIARKRAERERRHAERVKKIDERARRHAESLKNREAEEAARRAAGSGGASNE